MRGQDDVTALEAQRVQIRGTPTTGLKKSSLWLLFAFWRREWLRFGRKRRAKAQSINIKNERDDITIESIDKIKNTIYSFA